MDITVDPEIAGLRAELAALRHRTRRNTVLQLVTAVLLLAFGGVGGAYAVTLAAANSVNSAAIIDGSITSADVHNGSVTSADLLNGTVTSSDLHDNTITGSDINEPTFVQVDNVLTANCTLSASNGQTAWVDCGSVTVTAPGNEFVSAAQVDQEDLSGTQNCQMDMSLREGTQQVAYGGGFSGTAGGKLNPHGGIYLTKGTHTLTLHANLSSPLDNTPCTGSAHLDGHYHVYR